MLNGKKSSKGSIYFIVYQVVLGKILYFTDKNKGLAGKKWEKYAAVKN
jgi:hypothetical protein